MIVREVMTSKLITVAPDDTLSHAANLLRQHQFHHLPVVRTANAPETGKSSYTTQGKLLLLEGLLTSYDIDLAAGLGKQSSSADAQEEPWQERRVVEVMHRTPLRVSPTTSVAAAAQILLDRGLNCLPVVEYASSELPLQDVGPDIPPVLIGLLTRSDLLLALSRITGTFEPGVQLIIPLPPGDVTPLAKMLLLAAELRIQVSSVVAAPPQEGAPRVAVVHVNTIHPAPLLLRLREANIEYRFADSPLEGDTYVARR
jgi:acetoin utilization protein AcuB